MLEMVGIFEEKKPLGRPSNRWHNNNKKCILKELYGKLLTG
jgi:hypothetical protein